MTARYLIRLDDACHTMDRLKWRLIEDMLDAHGVRPIVAVVPDNRDPELIADSHDPMFWQKVRSWRDKGWTIAMHGYQHVMHSAKRSALVLPFYDRSEFGGLPYAQQAEKIRASAKLFSEQGVAPAAWIAPAHCFDWATLRAIHEETEIRVVSDGIAFDCYFEEGFYWVPQQLWTLQERRAGLWTVCLHPSMMTEVQIAAFGEAIAGQYRDKITSMDDLDLVKRSKSILDRMYYQYFWNKRLVVESLVKLRARLRG